MLIINYLYLDLNKKFNYIYYIYYLKYFILKN